MKGGLSWLKKLREVGRVEMVLGKCSCDGQSRPAREGSPESRCGIIFGLAHCEGEKEKLWGWGLENDRFYLYFKNVLAAELGCT